MQIWKKNRFFSNEEIQSSVDKEGQFWCCIDPKGWCVYVYLQPKKWRLILYTMDTQIQ